MIKRKPSDLEEEDLQAHLAEIAQKLENDVRDILLHPKSVKQVLKFEKKEEKKKRKAQKEAEKAEKKAEKAELKRQRKLEKATRHMSPELPDIESDEPAEEAGKVNEHSNDGSRRMRAYAVLRTIAKTRRAFLA